MLVKSRIDRKFIIFQCLAKSEQRLREARKGKEEDGEWINGKLRYIGNVGRLIITDGGGGPP